MFARKLANSRIRVMKICRVATRQEGDNMSFKIGIIGAGSLGFTKRLISDLLKVPELADCELALTDTNEHNLDMIRQIVEKLISVNGLPTKVNATVDRRQALAGA